jgi:hypothetical protein
VSQEDHSDPDYIEFMVKPAYEDLWSPNSSMETRVYSASTRINNLDSFANIVNAYADGGNYILDKSMNSKLGVGIDMAIPYVGGPIVSAANNANTNLQQRTLSLASRLGLMPRDDINKFQSMLSHNDRVEAFADGATVVGVGLDRGEAWAKKAAEKIPVLGTVIKYYGHGNSVVNGGFIPSYGVTDPFGINQRPDLGK